MDVRCEHLAKNAYDVSNSNSLVSLPLRKGSGTPDYVSNTMSCYRPSEETAAFDTKATVPKVL